MIKHTKEQGPAQANYPRGEMNDSVNLRQEILAGFAAIREQFSVEQGKAGALERALAGLEKSFTSLEGEIRLVRSDIDRLVKAVEDGQVLQRLALLEREKEDHQRSVDAVIRRLDAIDASHREELKALKADIQKLAEKVETSQWKMVMSLLAAAGAVAMAIFQWFLQKKP